MHTYSTPDRGSTTEPNTPESVERVDFSGDFARLVPTSRQARLAFHRLALVIDTDSKYAWNRRFIHINPEPEELEPEHDDASTGGDSFDKAQSPESTIIKTGFWRLSLLIPTQSLQLGYIAGKGYYDTGRANMLGEGGGVDMLMSVDGPQEKRIRGRHFRLLHSLESRSLMLFADKKTRVGALYLSPTQAFVFHETSTVIAFGDLEYQLEFTGLSKEVYNAQLEDHMLDRGLQAQVAGELVDPTPSESDSTILNKYWLRRSFLRGGTSYICHGVVISSGKNVVIKKMNLPSKQDRELAENEIRAMKRLEKRAGAGYPETVIRMLDSVFAPASTRRGVAECSIIYAPMMTGSLSAFVTQNLPPATCHELVRQTAEGLKFIHGHGCMHRDMKPQNVVGSLDPVRAVIIDFGCATFETTSKDHMKGTIHYLAPEILAIKDQTSDSDTTYCRSADIWGFGLIAWELLHGYHVPGDVGRTSNRHSLSTTKLKLLAAADQEPLREVIRRAVAWEPTHRLSAGDAVEMLSQVQNRVLERDAGPPVKRRLLE